MAVYFLAAIPLVDSDFNLLPVHFVVDPGLSWNGIDCFDDEDRQMLLRRYLDVQMIAVPGSETLIADNDIQINGEVPTSVPVLKADSWNELAHAVSDDSEDTGCANFVILHHDRRKGNTKDRKGNGAMDCEPGSKSSTLSRNKLPLTMQNVARSFGSLGRSFRRLRKNITRIACRNTLKHIERPVPVATSTEHGHLVMHCFPNQNCILCASLLHRRQPYQEEMVRNYLVSAAERFKCECEKQQTTVVDQLNSSSAHDAAVVSSKTSCVNTGCRGTGDASTSYLCTECFERHQQEEIGSAVPSHVVAPSGSVIGIATRVPVVSSSITRICSVEPESVHAAASSSGASCFSGLPSAVVLRHRPNTALDGELDELSRSAERLPTVLTKTLTLRAE